MENLQVIWKKKKDKVEYLIDDEILVIRCVLSVQIEEEEEHKENIFCIRYHVDNKVHNMIIDGVAQT